MASQRWPAASLAILLLSVSPALTNAAALHVGAGQTYLTIQAAVNASSPGDSIVVHDGTYVENVTVSHQLAIVSKDFLDNGEYDDAILDAGSNYISALTIYASGVTVEGLSITGAPVPANAIQLSLADSCRIEHNRIGWDDTHSNGTAVYVDASNFCIIENNFVGRSTNLGVYLYASSATEVRYNTFANVYGSQGYAVYLAGWYDVAREASNCLWNNVEQNQFTNCTGGVVTAGYVTNNEVRDNNFTDNTRGVFLGPGGALYNIVLDNDFSANGINIVLDGASYNTIVDNVLDGDGTGIRIGYQSPFEGDYNLIGWNSISNHALGLYIGSGANDNFILGNNFIGNAQNVEEHHPSFDRYSEDPQNVRDVKTHWNSPTTLSYFYGSNHGNLLGNYYGSYAGTDTDGDGVGDTGLPFDDGDPTAGPVENYPLVSPRDQYGIEAWYLDGDTSRTMYHRDRTNPVREIEIGPSEQIVWVSDQSANGNVDYPEGTWTGCLSFDGVPSPNDLTLEIGSSSNGTDFTASGAQASIGGSSMNMFETTSAAVSVADGHYLAVRLTENTGYYSHKVLGGGMMSYISSTGDGDPEWPGPATRIGTTPRPGITLRQNYPNPFNPMTTIEFSVPEQTFASLAIYNIRGQHIVTLVSETVGPGLQVVRWDGREKNGNETSSGIYFYRLHAGGDSITRKMLVVR